MRPAPPRRQPEGEKKVTRPSDTLFFHTKSTFRPSFTRVSSERFLKPERLTRINRRNPTDVLLRFALAEDENGEAWVIPDSNAVYPGRGMRVLPSYAALEMCAQSRSFTNSFKRPHVRLPLGIEGLFVLFPENYRRKL